ncbi:hypothetical protein [Methylobrevis albus]|uniref:Uncharacterized protein n=1 Tax=Methylobrevis albus TaxID=2793297 RepID=A0A931N083_9HYPH|nr:hypothetical protein [Methylobrevis albus]MBH0238914.1 hypothetical protein [Methylobrevis albus]
MRTISTFIAGLIAAVLPNAAVAAPDDRRAAADTARDELGRNESGVPTEVWMRCWWLGI